jgi:hypothetical protein
MLLDQPIAINLGSKLRLIYMAMEPASAVVSIVTASFMIASLTIVE